MRLIGYEFAYYLFNSIGIFFVLCRRRRKMIRQNRLSNCYYYKLYNSLMGFTLTFMHLWIETYVITYIHKYVAEIRICRLCCISSSFKVLSRVYCFWCVYSVNIFFGTSQERDSMFSDWKVPCLSSHMSPLLSALLTIYRLC